MDNIGKDPRPAGQDIFDTAAEVIAQVQYGFVFAVPIPEDIPFDDVHPKLLAKVEELQEAGQVKTPTASFIVTAPVPGYVLIYKDEIDKLHWMSQALQTVFAYRDIRKGLKAVQHIVNKKGNAFGLALIVLATGINPETGVSIIPE